MTATNMCSNFGDFRCGHPLVCSVTACIVLSCQVRQFEIKYQMIERLLHRLSTCFMELAHVHSSINSGCLDISPASKPSLLENGCLTVNSTY